MRLLFKFTRFPATMAEKTIRSSGQAVSVQLTESDIPGAFLSEPMASHTVLTGDANRFSSHTFGFFITGSAPGKCCEQTR